MNLSQAFTASGEARAAIHDTGSDVLIVSDDPTTLHRMYEVNGTKMTFDAFRDQGYTNMFPVDHGWKPILPITA